MTAISGIPGREKYIDTSRVSNAILMKTKLTRLKYFTYGIVCFIAIVFILKVGSFILLPLVWSAFFAFALVPLTSWFENYRIPRLPAILLSMLLVTVAISLIMVLFITQLSSLLHDLPAVDTRFNEFIAEIRQRAKAISGVSHLLSRDPISFVDILNIDDLLRFTTTTVTAVSLLPIFIFLLLYYQDFFREFISRVTVDTSFTDWFREAIIVVRKYITGMLVVTLIVSVLASMIFYFLGIKYFLLLGLFTAVCNLIPYVGVVIGSIVTILYVLLTTDQIWYPLTTLFLLWLLQVIENNLITPFVVGARVKLNPLVVIIAIITGGALWGISGMILFIPLLGTVKIFFDKSENLRPYSFLLGDEIPVREQKENFVTYLKRRYWKHTNA